MKVLVHKNNDIYIYILYIYIYISLYIWVNYNDLTATSLESWLVRGIIPKWPYFRLVKYYNLPIYIYTHIHSICLFMFIYVHICLSEYFFHILGIVTPN